MSKFTNIDRDKCFSFLSSSNYFLFLQEKLDDKKEVVSKLTYQLESALADARRQAETQREKNIAKVCSR